MINKDLGKIVGKNISWLSSMKQKGGYAGPVSHYWKDCLAYIGPGTDWRYEGLMDSFLTLFEKTKDKKFLNLALEAGDFILLNQKPDGSFCNSAFEGNPSFHFSGTPHEAAVDIALLRLAAFLKKKKLNYKKYFLAAEKNLLEIQIKRFYDRSARTFLNYEKGRAENAPNKYVPNKIATACEAFLAYYGLTSKKEFLKIALDASETMLSLQDKGEFYGGIYQANDRGKIITLYTARCIPCLLKISEIAKSERHAAAALDACNFLEKMFSEGGFRFGYEKNSEGSFARHDYPKFLAGSGDIIRAVGLAKGYGNLAEKFMKPLLKSQDANGAFRTSYGMAHKLKEGSYSANPSWRDVLHVAGWNDKALRLLSELWADENLPSGDFQGKFELECPDGSYFEDNCKIAVEGPENYLFGKNKRFSNGAEEIKSTFYDFALGTRGPLHLAARGLFKLGGNLRGLG